MLPPEDLAKGLHRLNSECVAFPGNELGNRACDSHVVPLGASDDYWYDYFVHGYIDPPVAALP